ncbi:MAG TPA: transketolase C-terminal domain-containing protein, partial [Candidatus Paceibacterota bacterium]|nr:transketolase C-terminal domain-containing protein [Candidatus Paceibacterota bacterium]
MLTDDSHIISNFFDEEKIDKKPIRDGYGRGLVEAGEKNDDVVVLSADLKKSTRSHWFADKFPERFFEVGVAEQNLATVASGLGVSGKIPFISSFAAFSPGRNWEQIRTTVVYNDANVKIAGHHAGILTGEDGVTHQAIEDIATMRVMPNMKIIVPADINEAKKAVVAAVDMWGPVYIRLSRVGTPVFTTEETSFVPQKAQVFWESKKPEVVIIACGHLVYNSLKAAHELEDDGVDTVVLNSHTVKPLDEKTILEYSKRAGAVVTVEDHSVKGGLGGAVSELLSREMPVPVEFVGVDDE